MGEKKNEITSFDKNINARVSSGLETWVNPETGETREFQKIEKVYYGQRHFWKMYLLDFLGVLGIVESKQLDVICYIMEKTSPRDNTFYGTFKQIAAATGVSEPTVSRAIQKLKGANFMKRISGSVYQINPEVMMQGHEYKKRNLVIQYNEAPEVKLMDEPIEVNPDSVEDNDNEN